MTTRPFPYGESLQFAWETFKKNATFLLAAVFIVFFVNLLLGIADAIGENVGGKVGFMMWVTYVLISAIIELGMMKICLKIVDGREPHFEDLFNTIAMFFKYAAASILYVVMVVIGMVFLVVPGIYLAIRFQFYFMCIIDEGLGPIAALEKSSRLTVGIKLDLFVFALLMGAINVAGAMCLMVGLFVSVPVSLLAYAFVYRYLNGPVNDAEIVTEAKAA